MTHSYKKVGPTWFSNLDKFLPIYAAFSPSVFLLSSSTVLRRYCDISVNSMTSWSVPKLSNNIA